MNLYTRHHQLLLNMLLVLVAGSMPYAWSDEIPENAWQVEIVEPAADSMHSIRVPFEVKAIAKNMFYFPDYLVIIWNTKNQHGNWREIPSFSPNAQYSTGGHYTTNLAPNWGELISGEKFWRIKAISKKDGRPKAETPWRYFAFYDPDSVPDLYISTFEPTPVFVGSEKRWHFTWTIRNKGSAIASPSKLRIICQSVSGEPCVSGIAGIYNIPQLWPKPNDASGATRVWNQPAVMVPANAKYRLKAELDIGDNLDITLSNNKMFTEFVADASQQISPDVAEQALSKQGTTQALVEQKPTVFGSRTSALTAAPKPLSGPAPSGLAPQPGTSPALTRQPLTSAPTMKPLSGPAPTLMKPPAMAKAPAAAALKPQLRHPVDTASQLPPVTDEQPGMKRQVVLARPVITYPQPNTKFTAPASFSVRAKLVSGKEVRYGLRPPGLRDVAPGSKSRFSNLKAGNYCVYVTYHPGGPESQCVPFSVRLPIKRAPMQATPKPVTPSTPTLAPKPVSPAPIKKMKPVPLMPGS